MKKIKKGWLLSLILIVVLSVALVGCADSDGDTQTGDPKTEDKIEEGAKDVKDAVDDTAKEVEEDLRDMNYSDIKIRPEEAFDKFIELHPDTKVTELKLDKGLMEYEYVIEGYDTSNEYEVKMNPVDGEVKSDDLEELDSDNEGGEIKREHVTKVDNMIDKAKEEDGSESELDEWSISIEDGKVVIEVEIGATEYLYDMDTEELIEKDN